MALGTGGRPLRNPIRERSATGGTQSQRTGVIQVKKGVKKYKWEEGGRGAKTQKEGGWERKTIRVTRIENRTIDGHGRCQKKKGGGKMRPGRSAERGTRMAGAQTRPFRRNSDGRGENVKRRREVTRGRKHKKPRERDGLGGAGSRRASPKEGLHSTKRGIA